MKRLASRKSHSWWWDSHISPKNSKWLSENLEQMDRLVKEMLKLIEEEGDSFAKKAEMYYRRRPELISHVEDFYRMYRALAERYNILTGELRKNIPSDLQSHGSGNSSDFGTEPASPSFSRSPDRTPDRKQNLPKPSKRAAGFDVFLGSTTSSDFSRKGSDDSSSSSSSESGSESEDGKVVDSFENTSGLNDRIIQLENELREAREKLMEYEKCSNGRCFHLAGMDEHHDPEDKSVAEAVDVEVKSDNKATDLETEISSREDELKSLKKEMKSLKEEMEDAAKRFEAEISLKDHTIEEQKTQLDAAMNKLKQEKSNFDAELKSKMGDLKMEAEKLAEKKSGLEFRILEQEQMIKELKVILAESSERFSHEKSILESEVSRLMNEENILASKLPALGVVEVEGELHSESEDKRADLEVEISNHKAEIKYLKEAMKEFEAEISLKDHTIEECKIQLDAERNKLKQEKCTVEAELKSCIADLKYEAENLSEKKSSLEIRILVLEQTIKELKVMSAKAFERLFHEKAILESKVCILMDSVNIHASKLKALEVEAQLHSESVDKAVALEAEISNRKGEIKSLKEAMEAAAKQFDAEISRKDHTIEENKTKHDEAMNKFMQENSTLEAELRSCISDLKLEVKQLSDKKSSLEIIILKQEQMMKELKAMSKESSERLLNEKTTLESKISSLLDLENIHASKLQALEDRIRELEVDKTEACNKSTKRIDKLNRSLDESKLKIDMLTSEKDELNARVSKLMDDARCRDDNCQSMADHLHQLHIEHVNLIKEVEEERKNSAQLMSRVKELEQDVERQRVLILDSAEGKREAIRQLCFSLEHYRDGYLKLRQMLQGNAKRLVVMAT